MRALEAWLEASGCRFGPVFRKVNRWGDVEPRLGTDAVRDILLAGRRREADGAWLERLSPHGLRAGFITEAYRQGARDEEVMDHTRHRDLRTMRGYVRRAKLLSESPVKKLGLWTGGGGAGEGLSPALENDCWRCRTRTGSTTTCASPESFGKLALGGAFPA